MKLLDKNDLRRSQRALDDLVEMASKNSDLLDSIRGAVDENEGILQETEERLEELKKMEADLEREKEALLTAKLELHADKIRYDGLMKKAEERLDLLNRQPIALLEEALLALECDETPAAIAQRFRDTHQLLNGQWS